MHSFGKTSAFLAPSLWLLSLFLMFNFASSSFLSYTPLALFERYLYPVLFPSVILTSGLIGKLFSRDEAEGVNIYREKIFWGLILTVFLLVAGGYQTFRSVRGVQSINDWTSEVRAVSAILKPADKVYTDSISIKGLEFSWRYPIKYGAINFEGLEQTSKPEAGSFVFINQRYINWLVNNAGMWLNNGPKYSSPFFLESISPSWKIIWQNSNATLYKVE